MRQNEISDEEKKQIFEGVTNNEPEALFKWAEIKKSRAEIYHRRRKFSDRSGNYAANEDEDPAVEYEGAFECYMAAAEQGHAAAQYELGLLYKNGLGTKKSTATARKWISRSAQLEYKKAIAWLSQN